MEMTLGPGPGRIPGPGELQLTPGMGPGMEPGPGVRTGADTGDGAGSQHRGRDRTGADTKDGAGPDPLGAAFPFCSRGQRGPAPRGRGTKAVSVPFTAG